MKEKIEPEAPRVSRLRIPDSDAVGWIKTLYESGFTGEEVEKIMMAANDEYASQKLSNIIDRLTWQMEEKLRQLGRTLSDKEKEEMRVWAREQLRKMPTSVIEGLRKKE